MARLWSRDGIWVVKQPRERSTLPSMHHEAALDLKFMDLQFFVKLLVPCLAADLLRVAPLTWEATAIKLPPTHTVLRFRCKRYAANACSKTATAKVTPESVLKKRKANEKIAADRAAKAIERKKVPALLFFGVFVCGMMTLFSEG